MAMNVKGFSAALILVSVLLRYRIPWLQFLNTEAAGPYYLSLILYCLLIHSLVPCIFHKDNLYYYGFCLLNTPQLRRKVWRAVKPRLYRPYEMPVPKQDICGTSYSRLDLMMDKFVFTFIHKRVFVLYEYSVSRYNHYFPILLNKYVFEFHCQFFFFYYYYNTHALSYITTELYFLNNINHIRW